MQEVNGSNACLPLSASDVLPHMLRDRPRQLRAKAIEMEFVEWPEARQQLDADGRRHVVHYGCLPKRAIGTGLGEVAAKQPRVHDPRISTGDFEETPVSVAGARMSRLIGDQRGP